MRGFISFVRQYAGPRSARRFVAELQDALDECPWVINETEEFAHQGEALPGVYQVLLTRVLFPREVEPGFRAAPVART